MFFFELFMLRMFGLFYGCCVVWVLIVLDADMFVCYDLAASGVYVC